ncbi:hypothetical protein SC171_16585 [Pantoea cypripedii]
MTHHAEISAQPVVRDRWGGWTHPDFFIPADDREYALPGEFEAWLAAHHLKSATTWMDNDVPEEMAERFRKTGNCNDWQPSKPPGEGWFTGAIHDTEDGAVCIWLCQLKENPAA